MGVINQHWYDRNASTAYPLDDKATSEADAAGGRLPADILVDLNLRWPKAYGEAAFLAAVTCGPGLASILILSAPGPDAVAGFQPLAAIAARQPVETGRVLALTPLVPGVGGWAVFGPGATRASLAMRFATPQQGLLALRAARPYRPAPVTGMGSLASLRPLQGIVGLAAEQPLVVEAGPRDIDGVKRTVAVIRLADDDASGAFAVPEAGKQALGGVPSVFEEFAGPCGARPESGNCGDPLPIEFFNGVGPDCDGVITIAFTGCAQISGLAGPGGCGVLVDCGLGLQDACVPQYLPDDTGRLPSQYDPAVIPIPIPESIPGVPPTSESVADAPSLPYLSCFDELPPDAEIVSGLWSVSEVAASPGTPCPTDAPNLILTSATAAVLNLLSWEELAVGTLGRVVTTHLRLEQGPLGALHNGGLVLNRRSHDTVPGQFVYHTAEIDYDAKRVMIRRWNGASFQVLVDVTVPGLQLGKWYRLQAAVTPGSSGQAHITVDVAGLEDAVGLTIGPLATSGYAPSIGRFGLMADRAVTLFDFFEIAAV